MEIQTLIQKLNHLPIQDLSQEFPQKAVVGIGLRGQSSVDLEVLFIQRATKDVDPWSGQIAFPGGHAEPGETDVQTLAREIQEELGIEIPYQTLGRLDDHQARKAGAQVPLFVRPLVFELKHSDFQLDPEEVAGCFLRKVKDLVAGEFQTKYRMEREGQSLQFPAVEVGRALPLWGLSYLMIEDLLNRLVQIGILKDSGAFQPWRIQRKELK